MRSLGLETVLVSSVAHGNWDTMGVDVRVRSVDNVGIFLASIVLDVALFLNRDSVGRFVAVLEASIMSMVRFTVDNWDVLVFNVLVFDGYGNGQQGGQCDEL